MPRKVKHTVRPERVRFFLFGVIAALAVVFGFMLLVQAEKERLASSEIHVSLGSMRYDLSSGKAVKRTDETVKSLEKFLIEDARKSASEHCTPYNYVVAASKDEKQVRLAYGCDHPSAHMFAVNEGGTWRMISPTNQFDMTGVPMCSHVNEHAIDVSLAPVCFTPSEAGAAPTYSVR